ncbi:MAG: ABC transporter substrate-binding protein [Legionellales bacterium]|nr:ABC transporter substrate-binding protein [Legionellales bacterium]
MKKVIAGFSILFLSVFITSVFAGAATNVMRQVADSMIAQLKSKQIAMKSNPQAVYSLVRQTFLPHVDMNLVSRAVLGQGWTKANAAQQKQFINQFTNIVIGTYAQALASYTNEKVVFTREIPQSENTVRVDSQIIRTQGPSIPVSYRLINRGGQWKIYDLIVEGVSLVQSYRSQFRDILARQGMSGLLNTMVKHNAKFRT